MKLILPGTVETIATRVDGTMKIVFSTQEIGSSQGGDLLQLRGKYCKILLSDSNITQMEEKLVDEEVMLDGKKVKSQSQRLRAVIYRLWEQSKSTIDFDDYYKTETERILDHYKQKLA